MNSEARTFRPNGELIKDQACIAGKNILAIDDVASTSSISSGSLQWMWNSTAGPFSKSEPDDFHPYDDVENMIIEEAFKAGKTHVILDDYHIDLKRNLQITNNDVNEQRLVKRIMCVMRDKRWREERFLPNPVAPDRPFGGQYGFISPFIKQVAKELGLRNELLPSKNKTIVPTIVEKATLGIIEEGKKIGKQLQAEQIAKVLTENKESGMKEVWICCARLYTMNSFLFKTVNETMRLIGNEQHYEVWRSKIGTLGPYCLLLWDNPFNSKIAKPGTVLYRGTQLSDDLITVFKGDCSKDPKPWRSFQAFTSCTRNPDVAEIYGNVLFIMKTRVAFTIDIQPFSNFPDEEEELLFPGVCFTIDQMEYDENKNKHLIYLTLQQKYNRSDKHELNPNSTQQNQPNEPDIYSFNFDYLRRRDLDYDDYDDDGLDRYYENRYRSALDRIDLRDILAGHGIDITCFAKENSDLLLHNRLERSGLNDAWSED